MTDPMSMSDLSRAREQEGVWSGRLMLFLRAIAILSLMKGLYHWSGIAGIGQGAGGGFEASPLSWQVATIFFAVIDLVAAVGLWLAAAWGGVVWLTAAISMAAVELFFPQIFGGRVWVMLAEAIMIGAYVTFAVMAGREQRAA
jgi:hypothetical protein